MHVCTVCCTERILREETRRHDKQLVAERVLRDVDAQMGREGAPTSNPDERDEP
jgi:hypothetical protein